MSDIILFKEESYLKATDLQLGLLVNFGHYPKLETERFINLKKV